MEDEKDESSQIGLGEIVEQLAVLALKIRELAEKPLFDNPGNYDVHDDDQALTAVATAPLP